MTRAWIRIGVAGGFALVLAGCGGKGLINISRGQVGPDEFAILPNKPLEIPTSLPAQLPPPVPGEANRVDPTPHKDAVAALGGNPNRLDPGRGVDGGLTRTTGRYGTDPNIRSTLAAEDAQFRKRNRGRVLERLFGVSVYWKKYRQQELDQYQSLEHYRAGNAKTPGVPPLGAQSEDE